MPDDRLRFKALFFGANKCVEARSAVIRETLNNFLRGRPEAVLTVNVTAELNQLLYWLDEDETQLDVIFVSNEVGLGDEDYVSACQIIAEKIGRRHNRPWIALGIVDVPVVCDIFERQGLLVRCAPDAAVVRLIITVRCTYYS